jgi:spermidine synthase
MLGSLLLGVALGARLKPEASQLPRLYALLALGILLNQALLGALPEALMLLLRRFHPGFAAFQGFEFALSFSALLPATLLQGMLFPMLLRLGGDEGRGAQARVGGLFAMNSLGAILGALAAGLWLIPHFGLQPCFAASAGIAAALGLLLRARSAAWSAPRLALALLLCGAASLFAAARFRPWNPLLMSSGAHYNGLNMAGQLGPEESFRTAFLKENRLLFYREGREATVAVRESKGERALAINGKVDATLGGDGATQKMLAHFPLALHPGAGRALLIGWGSGGCVEIEPAVFEAAPFFQGANFEAWKDPRFRIRFEDGRAALRASQASYDVIISEPSNPWISGVANLFTLDFYRLALSRLAEGGLFAQWFHYYSMSEEDLKAEIRTFCAAFPGHSLWFIPYASDKPLLSGDLLLLGSREPRPLDYALAGRALRDPKLAPDLKRCGIEDPFLFLSHRLLEQEELTRYTGPGPLNSDDRPLIEFSAPKSLLRSTLGGAQSAAGIFSSLDRAARLPFPAVENAPPSAASSPASRALLLRRIGGYYCSQGLLERATALLMESLRLNPSDPEAGFELGRAHFFSRRFGEAEALLKRAMQAMPSSRKAYVYLGSLYFNLKDPSKGHEVYLQMTRRLPKEAEGWFGLGASAMHLGRKEEAREDLKRALELDPGMEKAAAMLSGIQ